MTLCDMCFLKMVLDWMAFAFADYGDGGDKIISISVPESIGEHILLSFNILSVKRTNDMITEKILILLIL